MNKVLLENSYTHLLMYCLWLSMAIFLELSGWNRSKWLEKSKNIYYLALNRKFC